MCRNPRVVGAAVLLCVGLICAPASSSAQTPPAGAPPAEDETGTRERAQVRESRTRQKPVDADAVVKMTPAEGRVHVGDRVTVEVTIAARREIGHTPFHVKFDPSVLRFESADEGDFLAADGNETVFLTSVSGGGDAVVVGLSRLGQGPGVTGAGELCRLHFVAVGSGSAGLAFARAGVRDGANQPVKASFVPATWTVY
jgi:hypothetical protein